MYTRPDAAAADNGFGEDIICFLEKKTTVLAVPNPTNLRLDGDLAEIRSNANSGSGAASQFIRSAQSCVT